MGVYEGRGALSKAIKQLQLHWAETRMHWDDVQSRVFEQRFLLPLENDLRQALAAMDHMSQVMAQARKDCQ